jgi:hypothetical protein
MILFLTCLVVVVVVVMGGGEYHALEGIIIYFCSRNFIWDIKKKNSERKKRVMGFYCFHIVFV